MMPRTARAMEQTLESTDDRRVMHRILRVAYAATLFLVVLGMFPYTPRPTEEIKILIYQVAASLFLVLFLIDAVVTRRPFIRPPLLFPVIMAFLVLNAIAAVASDFVMNSVYEWSKLASFVAIYAVATQVYRTEREMRTLLVTGCVAVALSSLYAFAQKAGYDPFPWNQELLDHEVYKNLPGTFGNPNIAGHALILALIASLYLASLPGTRWCGVLSVIFVVHMAFTDQRSVLLAIGAATTLVVFALAFRRITRRPTLAMAGVAASLIVVLCAAVWGVGLWFQRTGGLYAPIDNALRLRYNAFSSAAAMIHDRPGLGFGPGNYLIANTPYWTPYEQAWFGEQHMMNFHVHNDFLEAAVDAGVVGGVLYVLVFVFAVAGGTYLYMRLSEPSERRLGLALAAAFFAFAVDGFFGFNVHVPVSGLMFFLFAGLLDGLFARALPATASPPRERNVFWPLVLSGAAVVNTVAAGAVFASEVYFLRGQGAHVYGALDAAQRAFTRSAELAPWNWLMPYHQGIVATAQGRAEDAAAHFYEALDRNPYFIPALSYLAQNQFNRGAPVLISVSSTPDTVGKAEELLNQAVVNANKALALCAYWPESEDILGRIDFVRGTRIHSLGGGTGGGNAVGAARYWRSATTHFERALDLGITAPKEPLRLLAQIHLYLNEPRKAEAYLHDALDAHLHDTTTWPTFWEYAQGWGAYPQMRYALERRIDRLMPATDAADRRAAAEAYRWLTRVQFEGMQDADAAAETHCRFVTLDPLNEEAWNQYAHFAQNTGTHAAFEHCVRELASSEQAAHGMLSQVAAVAMAENETPDSVFRAASFLAEVTRTNASRDALEAHGIDWAAPIVLQHIQAIDSDSSVVAQARALLGEVFQVYGDLETARSLLAKAIPHLDPPDSSAAATRFAAVLQLLGQPGDAVDVLRNALSRDPQNGRLRLEQARALATAGRQAEARLEYQSILRGFQLDDDTRAQVQREMEALRPATE